MALTTPLKPTVAPDNICTDTKTVTLGRMELELKCQVGIHRGGHCRMVLPGTEVIVMWKGPNSYRGSE